jgi:hypothetical protein
MRPKVVILPAVSLAVAIAAIALPIAGVAQALAAADGDAGPARFEHMAYSVPRGWQEKRYAGAVMLSPREVPQGEHLDVVLMSPKVIDGDLPAALAASWTEACTLNGTAPTRTVDGTAYAADGPRRSFRGWEYVRGNGIVRAAADGRDYFFNLSVIKVNDRFERILITGKQNRHQFSDYSLYDSPAYNQALQEFIFGMNFDDWTAPEVKPASLDGGGVIGAWHGISMFGGELKSAYAIFFSNGQVFFGSRPPLGGCHQFNTWVDSEMVPRYWGSYEFENGQGRMKMIYGEVPVRLDGDVLVITTNRTPHRFAKLASVDGARIQGRYAFADRNGKAASIAFRADGHFEDDGALDVLNPQVNYPFKVTARPGGGTYAVKDYSITFEYADGRTLRLAFMGTDYDRRQTSPATLTVGYADQVLKKR